MGSGTLILSGANTYVGQTFVNAGVLQLQNNTALGNATAGAATVVASGASVQVLGSGLNINKSIILNGSGAGGTGALENLIGGSNTWSGAIILQGAASIGVDAGTTLTLATNTINGLPTGGITGGGDLTKVGVGTLVINAPSTGTGNAVVANGILNLQNGVGLGLAAAVGGGAVTVQSGATLQLQGGITVGGKSVTLNGTGFGNSGALPQGALVNQAGNNTWAGNVVLTGTVGLTAGTIPLLSAGNTSSLIGAVNATTLFITGVVSGTDLTKVGAGAVSLLNANTYTGSTTVLGGTLTLANNNNAAVGATVVSGMAVNAAFTA